MSEVDNAVSSSVEISASQEKESLTAPLDNDVESVLDIKEVEKDSGGGGGRGNGCGDGGDSAEAIAVTSELAEQEAAEAKAPSAQKKLAGEEETTEQVVSSANADDVAEDGLHMETSTDNTQDASDHEGNRKSESNEETAIDSTAADDVSSTDSSKDSTDDGDSESVAEPAAVIDLEEAPELLIANDKDKGKPVEEEEANVVAREINNKNNLENSKSSGNDEGVAVANDLKESSVVLDADKSDKLPCDDVTLKTPIGNHVGSSVEKDKEQGKEAVAATVEASASAKGDAEKNANKVDSIEKPKTPAPVSENNVVDLLDNSDVEMSPVKSKSDDNIRCSPKKVGAAATAPNTEKLPLRISNSDSDGAVIIGSDSENECNGPAPSSNGKPHALGANGKPPTSSVSSTRAPTDLEDDDDDDDCVVIEDDAVLNYSNDIMKRKSYEDKNGDMDEVPPPCKRQRNHPTGDALKDSKLLSMGVGGVGPYPINITPSPGMQGPPKLTPIGSQLPPVGALPAPVINANANLLPGLTDDMFVLEAPSFIVPYIYEKPPSISIQDVVKEIETKYKLTKEDLAEVEKTDEFDMMTEQNKEKSINAGGKRKKNRGGDDVDDSWSEDSEEDDDDDDDSDSEMRTKVLIKEASDDLTAIKGAIKPPTLTANASAAKSPSASENYFESPLGRFFMDIGVGLVQEFVQTDLIRLQKRKMRKSLGKNIGDCERAIEALSANLEASKKKNESLKFTMKRCEFCNFKSESALAMANHYETPHMNGVLYKCNFCSFEIRNATEIVYHMEAMHNIKARLIKPLPYHQCPNCGFEDNGKAKLARHQPVCAKKFKPEVNLAPPGDWEAPAKIPRIKPRHGLVGTATAYQAMAAQAAAQKAALATIQQQQAAAQQQRNMQAAAALVAQNSANKIRGRPPIIPNKIGNNNSMLRHPNQIRGPMDTSMLLSNNYMPTGVVGSGPLIMPTAANLVAKKTLTGQPSISITPLPRQSATANTTTNSPSTSKNMSNAAGGLMKPGQSPSSSGNSKSQFVICEVCDGYIKDLEQLRNHMQWMHKVKIHPKMIYNRPPLNCQKCQYRFFTDQGLERHLLGSHGLVTSSMQEAANKGKDAGRCPVCGRMYQWKLLNHVSRDHHMTLKPAHLSYKCTVCTATFGMYKQFETHVYTAHSTVAKKAIDGKNKGAVANSSPTGVSSTSGGGGSSLQRNNISVNTPNDSLLRPLKINDEITIIPQPTNKPRVVNPIESHVID